MNPIREYYQNLPESNLDISNLKWRFFRLYTKEYGWIQNKRKIRTAQQLKEFLVKYAPIKAYMSSSFWYNPQDFHGKKLTGPGFPVASTLFLGQELVFDFDAKDKSELEQVRFDVLKLLKYMKTINIFLKI